MAGLPTRYRRVVTSFDRVLRQMLKNFFRERRLAEDQIKEFLRARENTERDSLIKLILEQEPFLSEYFSKEELGKLSLLWIAVLGYYHKSAKLLVRSGANVNEICGLDKYLELVNRKIIKRDSEWNTSVLHVLFLMEHSRKIDRLISLVADHGADLQARDYFEQTVLHLAVSSGRVRLTEMLLEKGADANAADEDGQTPLFMAVNNNSQADKLIPLFLKHAADFFVNDSHGQNILHHLAWAPVEQAVELARVVIERGVPFEERDKDGCQPIHLAALKGRNELVNLLLDYGANVNAPTIDGGSLLHLVAEYNQPRVMETLIKRGADIDLRTTEGRSTALHVACAEFHEETVKILVSAGADVLAEDSSGNTPLSLIDLLDMESPSIKLMIRVLALKKVSQPTLELKDERIIKAYPILCNYYRGCVEEMKRMKATKFIETSTYFDLLTKSHRQIAELMRNPSFETNFWQYDRSGFFMCAEDLLQAFERAQKRYHSMLQQESVISAAVYNILPYMVVRTVVHYIFNDS